MSHAASTHCYCSPSEVSWARNWSALTICVAPYTTRFCEAADTETEGDVNIVIIYYCYCYSHELAL